MSFPSHITNIYELLEQEGEPSVPIPRVAPTKDTKPAAAAPSKGSSSHGVKSTQQSSSVKTSSPRDSQRRGDRQEGRSERGGFQEGRSERGGFRQDSRPPRAQGGEPQRDRMGAFVDETPRQPIEFARRDRPVDRDNSREGGESRGDQRRRGAPAGGFTGNRRFNDRKSGTGRGREEKKGGGGRGNWGLNDGSETVPEETVEGAEQTGENTTEAEPEKVHVETEKEKAWREEREKEDKLMSLDDYLKQREEKRAQSSNLGKELQARKANEGVDAAQQKKWGSFKEIKRDDETEATTEDQSAEEKHQRKVKNTVRVDEIFQIKEQPRPRYDDDRRGGRGGRGGGRGGSRGGSDRRGGARGGAYSGERGHQAHSGERGHGQVDFSDPNSFPTLQ